MSYHYGIPPSHYTRYYGPNNSPYNSNEYVHYAPQYDTPPRKHTRKASYTPSPRVGGWYSPAGSPPPHYEPNVQFAVPRDEYVSEAWVKTRKHESYNTYPSSRYPTRSTSRKQNQPVYIYDAEAEYAGMPPTYIYREPKSSKPKHARRQTTDTYFHYPQEDIIDEQPKRSRARRSSTTTRVTHTRTKSSSHVKPPRQATEDDAIREGIPKGYSIKHWDPTELPIILLGSVFDANSLGKWIYDWTVFHHGASSPLADMAGELWLLLIKLAGKMKRAQECVHRVEDPEKQETLEDFIASGKRLWDKFKILLKDCEHYMLKVAKREGTKTMGKKSGTEFVDSIFGRDRYLEKTEHFMAASRLWNHRFDVNCEDTIRRPSVA